MRLLITLVFFLGVGSAGAQSLYSHFGNQGTLQLSEGGYSEPVAMQLLADDTLLLLANTGTIDSFANLDIILYKLYPNGQMDAAFGNGGKMRFDFSGLNYSAAADMLVLADGRIAVLGAGYDSSNTLEYPAALVLLHANGVLDSTFGVNGTLLLEFMHLQEYPHAIIQDQRGRLIIVGATLDSTHSHADAPVIARYFLDGTPDSAFGGSGKVLVDPNNGNYPLKDGSRHLTGGIVYDVLELSNGQLILSGCYSNGLQLVSFIIKMNADGSLDPSFNLTGMTTINISYGYNNQIVKLLPYTSDTILFGATAYSYDQRNIYWGKMSVSNWQYRLDTVDIQGNEDLFTDMVCVQGGGFALSAYSKYAPNSDNAYLSDEFAVALLDGFGSLNPSYFRYPFANGKQNGLKQMVQRSDGNYIAYGFTEVSGGSLHDLALLAFGKDDFTLGDAPTENISPSVFPNPADDRLNVEVPAPTFFQLYNIWGQLVLSTYLAPGTQLVSLKDLPNGTYTYHLGTRVGQVVVLH